MHSNHKTSCLAFAVLIFAFITTTLTTWAQMVVGSPTPLFDDRTLDGWVQRGGKAIYKVENGCIVGISVTNAGNTFLCTTNDYADFILELDVKSDTNLNSGIQIRSHCYDQPTTYVWNDKTNTIPPGRVHGYQIEVDNQQSRRWSGGIYDEARRGWLSKLETNKVAQQAFRFGEWNSYRIECLGDSIKVWVNGVPTSDLVDKAAASGFIGLQVHGTKTPGLEVRFRNIRIQELSEHGNSIDSDVPPDKSRPPTHGD